MFGAKLTLIVLTSQRLARIDLAGPRRRLRVERAVSCPRNTISELAASVAIAYRLGEPQSTDRSLGMTTAWQSRSVIVLSDDIWNDSVRLPLDVTVLLQENELKQALAIEAESYSGIPAFQSQFACRKLIDVSTKLVDASSIDPNATAWWVAQLAGSDLANMVTAAQACRFKLLGATYTGAYRYAAEYAAKSEIKPETKADLDFAVQSQLVEFGNRWASALSLDGLDLVIRAEDNTSVQGRLAWLQTSAALMTAVACAGAYQLRTSELNSSTARLGQLQESLSQYELTASKLKSVQARLQQSQQRLSKADAARQAQAHFIVKLDHAAPESNAQWLALFSALSDQTPEDCWIESWSSDDGQPILHGRAISAQTIQQLARQLEDALPATHWQVLTPIIRQGDDGLLHFELRLSLRAKVHVQQTSSPVPSLGDAT